MKNNQKSIFFTLFVSITFTILLAVFIVSNLFYEKIKEHIFEDINSDVKTSLALLKNSIYPFMDSYSINEYEKLIENEIKRNYVLAVIVEDFNMAKITDSKYIVGKICINNNAKDYDQDNITHQEILKSSYADLKEDIYNQEGLKLGTISIYASSEFVREKLINFIKIGVVITLLSTIMVLLVLYFVIHKIIQKPLSNIIKIINNKSDDGMPIETIPAYNSKELGILSSTLNNMISSIKDSNYQLDEIANTDMLTNLGNRYKLIKDIERSTNPALAIINIDNFSQLNDFYGYEVGDYIIKQVGQHISGAIWHKNASSYHIQGDEYVLFNHDINRDEFEKNIRNLVDIFAAISVEVNEEELNFNFTIGVSFENKDKILLTADMALKVARRNNENLMIYSEEISLNKEYENNIYWAKKIRAAIQEDRFIPVYQPIINNKTNKIEKYESLVRMRDAQKLISPFFFLEISKKTKYYSTITKVMIEKTFERFKDSSVEFSVNLTIEDILNKEIKEYIYNMLTKYNIASRVVFEIVETESIENFAAVLEFINNIKKIGAKIAIDDFGTGYSNFDYLMRLNVNYIKIDGSLIKEIDTNKQAEAVVFTIVDFAKRMGIKTIAEFVENENIQNKILDLGIDYSQGYYFSEPKEDPAKMSAT